MDDIQQEMEIEQTWPVDTDISVGKLGIATQNGGRLNVTFHMLL